MPSTSSGDGAELAGRCRGATGRDTCFRARGVADGTDLTRSLVSFHRWGAEAVTSGRSTTKPPRDSESLTKPQEG